MSQSLVHIQGDLDTVSKDQLVARLREAAIKAPVVKHAVPIKGCLKKQGASPLYLCQPSTRRMRVCMPFLRTRLDYGRRSPRSCSGSTTDVSTSPTRVLLISEHGRHPFRISTRKRWTPPHRILSTLPETLTNTPCAQHEWALVCHSRERTSGSLSRQFGCQLLCGCY